MCFSEGELSRPKAGFYTGAALYCPSSKMYAITLKLRPCQVKIDTVPLSFIQNLKYHSEDTRRAHPNREG